MNKFLLTFVLILGFVSCADKVKLDFYYEALCPACFTYLSTALKKVLYTEGLDQIYTLNLYPYGNGRQKLGSDGYWEFQCQHGKEECYGNLMESCIINLYKPNTNNKAIVCLETQDHRQRSFDKALATCAPQFDLDMDKIKQCMNSKEGNNFQHQIAVATDNLNPKHKWVPWMVINDQYDDEKQYELEQNPIQFICDTYKGTDKPSACNQKQVKSDKFQYCLNNDYVPSFLQ